MQGLPVSSHRDKKTCDENKEWTMLALFTFSDDPKKNLQHVPPPSIPSLIGKL